MIVCADPALTTGLTFAGVVVVVPLTVIRTVSLAELPLLSVTVKRNLYTPAVRFLTPVFEDVGSAIVKDGPKSFVQAYERIVPSGSELLDPSRLVVVAGNVTNLSPPGLTIGGIPVVGVVGGGVVGGGVVLPDSGATDA